MAVTERLRRVFEPAEEYRLVAELFLRLLALIYLVAFLSLAVQITGLVGEHGVLPVRDLLPAIEERFGARRWLVFPSLVWLDASDTALIALSLVGAVFALVLLLGWWRRLALTVLLACYLSLYHAGQTFLNFQWDYLLLESGFLAIFLVHGGRWVIWLYRWLLFRLRFLSGASKLLSGDPAWSGLAAVGLYFEVQPLPHSGAWFAHQLPAWLHQFGTGATLFVELVVPFMMFLPRGPRFFAAWMTIGLQVLIIFTSNHSFANLMTIVLCLFLFDDKAVARILPAALVSRLTQPRKAVSRGMPVALAGFVMTAIVSVSLILMWEMFAQQRVGGVLGNTVNHVRPFRLVNNYHVFPTMKTERVEVIIEGSSDGLVWHPYEFPDKPGDPARRPRFITPHQPRLDWMLWFLPMGHPVNNAWYEGLIAGLRGNAPGVVHLLAHNPFPDAPPRHLRASAWRYRFSDPDTRATTGAWWTREFLGPFPVPAPRP